MRKLKRSVARYHMIKAGFTNINRKDGEKSKFAKLWRNYV